jgi:hypothetical protein
MRVFPCVTGSSVVILLSTSNRELIAPTKIPLALLGEGKVRREEAEYDEFSRNAAPGYKAASFNGVALGNLG